MFTAPFTETYWSHYPKLSRVRLTSQAATDLLFDPSKLNAALAQIEADETFPGPYAGRVYVWVLTGVVDRIARDLWNFPRHEAFELFPAKATELGYAEWLRDFRIASAAVMWLRKNDEERLISDFEVFLDRGRTINPNLIYAKATLRPDIQRLYTHLDQIRDAANFIDNQIYLSQPYRLTERLRWQPVTALWLLTFGVGVLLPLVLLSRRPFRFLPLALSGLTAVLLLFLLFLFYGDLVGRPAFEPGHYVRARWYAQIAHLLREDESRIRRRELLSSLVLTDALSSPDSKEFPEILTSQLESYRDALQNYNSAL